MPQLTAEQRHQRILRRPRMVLVAFLGAFVVPFAAFPVMGEPYTMIVTSVVFALVILGYHRIYTDSRCPWCGERFYMCEEAARRSSRFRPHREHGWWRRTRCISCTRPHPRC